VNVTSTLTVDRRTIALRLATIALVITIVSGCATSGGFNPLAGGFNPLSSGPQLGSFIGVSFGDPSSDVIARYPQAMPETSPFGAAALRLKDVKSGAVVYKTVLFEFLWHGGGMQLVMAKFEPKYAVPIFNELTQRIGAPTLSKSADARTPRAQWSLTDGTSVSFNGTLGRLVIVGPNGKILSDDIRMREERGEEFAS
jgi:hypothetical protein